MRLLTWQILLMFATVFKLAVCGFTSVLLKRFENCEQNSNYNATFNFTITTVDNKQYIDGTMTYKMPFDNTIRSDVSVEMLVGKHYQYLFSINEKKSCDAVHKYMGEFMYDLERHAQLIPGMCPIPKGKYQLHNAPLDFKKFTTIDNFPFGNLRFKDVAYDRNNNTFFCVMVEAENRL